ncbi:Murein L,D-transpeptidase YcbB/YkuD [Flavobacterium succinicans]|uniref:Murein L,D-transpeptidase YcbB/YkuD n=1 Tax=Flavobacterium succinicans TaxID=29536 RepID=A0A1I4WUE4_9FLAO|nr:L,D-transpeptidase family protein [Flavobacterium succinicans]SFN17428.1 Murein L,D-transpeptidase YcbB/YkuD [Flavobacterium succinicans]
MKPFYLILFFLCCTSCKHYFEEQSTPVVTSSLAPIPDLKVENNAIPFDSSLVMATKNQSLIQFYSAAGFSTVWQSDSLRETVLSMIKTSNIDGLVPNDYQWSTLELYEKRHADLTEKELIEYDILITSNIQQLLSQLKNGKLDPKIVYDTWDLKKTPFNVNLLLSEAFQKKSFKDLVEKCRPTTEVYHQLLEALKIIRQYDDQEFAPIVYSKNIQVNDNVVEMKTIKKILRYWGDLKTRDSLTSKYDGQTLAAIKRFQERHGLVQDGVIGQGTIEALNVSKAIREKQIIANLERWRWFEALQNEDAVFINIPDYKLWVVENQDTTLVHKIVVGTSKRKTPILDSYLRTIVLNPTWTIPPTILVEDIVPAMLKNRNYLLNKNITIYSSTNEVVAPHAWNATKPHAYRYVQGPGPDNTLGEMKILFPNRHSIYLHDTNHRNLFGLSNRSLSSGCIRVEKPLELAEYFLNHSEQWPKEKMDSVVATRKTHYIKIEKKYNLHVWYWTAWSQKGRLFFRKDIYDYDLALYDSLRR